ncbi:MULTISPECIES: DUF4232 domain-containing protein [Streptomyces]|uniref:DUF4232 domain-containing protein n=1 Tax=Streptomyces TaxID=1883 RepID=UPI0007CD93D3|nr:hypothetical protein A4V12_16390 [Streptomyces noursei]
MRTFRTRTTAAAVTAVLAALSLTACQNDDASGAAGPSAPASAAPATTAPAPGGSAAGGASRTPATGGATGATGTSGGTTARPSADGPGAGKGSTTGGAATKAPSEGAPVTEPCGADVKVTYTPVSRPLNHGLLTLTNTGSQPCAAYHAPLLRFDDGQAATPVNDSSRPQAVVTLSPGAAAYASITLAAADGSGSDGGTVRKLAVHFAPRSGEGSTDADPAVIALPSGTYTDTSATVTHWQSSMDDALMY